MVFDQAGNGTYAGVMSGSGTLTKQGAGLLTLTGANSYSGSTAINAGSASGRRGEHLLPNHNGGACQHRRCSF